MQKARVVAQRGDEWFKARLHCELTGSEFAAALGISKNTSRSALYWNKVEPRHIPDTPPMIYGREMEDKALRCFMNCVHLDVQSTGLWAMVHRHAGEDYTIGASPDGIIAPDGFDQPISVVEIKCKFSGVLPAEPEPSHVTQCLLEMECSGAYKCYLVYWTDRHYGNTDWELVVFVLYKSTEVTQRLLRMAGDVLYRIKHPHMGAPSRVESRYKKAVLDIIQRYLSTHSG